MSVDVTVTKRSRSRSQSRLINIIYKSDKQAQDLAVYDTSLLEQRRVMSVLTEKANRNQLTAIKGELELQYYGRTRIIEVLESQVLSLPFTCFIDDFGLYRNMYRSLTGIHLTASTLTLDERQRTRC